MRVAEAHRFLSELAQVQPSEVYTDGLLLDRVQNLSVKYGGRHRFSLQEARVMLRAARIARKSEVLAAKLRKGLTDV